MRINSKLLLAVALIFAIAFSYTKLNGSNKLMWQLNDQFEVVTTKESDAANSVAQVVNQEKSEANQKSFIDSKYDETLGGAPSERTKVQKWQESRGYFSKVSLADYGTYDLETLKKLSNTGDLKAMMALAQFYLSDKYEGADRMQNYSIILKLAAAYGSTDALERLSNNYASQQQDVNNILSHEDLIEVLSWMNVASLRGDLMPNVVAAQLYKESIVHLTASDVTKIRERSKIIYDELVQQRMALGLGDFDNSRPPEVDKFFGYLDNYLDSKK